MNDDMGTGAARLDGRVVVVNGGTQGLGEATVRLLAARGAAGIAIVGRDADKGSALAYEVASETTRTIFVRADMTEPDAPAVVMSAVDKAFGVVHGLVNIAASTGRGNIWNTDIELWDTMQTVNVRAPFFMIQGAAKIMRREGVAGSIVNIGSVSGYGGQPFILAYSVSKGALATLTKTTAFSLMRHRVRVNQVNPGWMDTEAEDAVQRRFHGATDGWLEAAEAGQPMGRLIKPPEVARSIVFLLSDESGMMTGTIIDYDQSVQGAGDAPKPTLQETPQ
jgi:NAD(P)-dependent dehydrogenase (short-subunit alcohol dehydrogenase family)